MDYVSWFEIVEVFYLKRRLGEGMILVLCFGIGESIFLLKKCFGNILYVPGQSGFFRKSTKGAEKSLQRVMGG